VTEAYTGWPLNVLHKVADYLANTSELRVVAFAELASSNAVLN
jgi:hypothetical protein